MSTQPVYVVVIIAADGTVSAAGKFPDEYRAIAAKYQALSRTGDPS